MRPRSQPLVTFPHIYETTIGTSHLQILIWLHPPGQLTVPRSWKNSSVMGSSTWSMSLCKRVSTRSSLPGAFKWISHSRWGNLKVQIVYFVISNQGSLCHQIRWSEISLSESTMTSVLMLKRRFRYDHYIHIFILVLTVNPECKIKDCNIDGHLDHSINDVLFCWNSRNLDYGRLVVGRESLTFTRLKRRNMQECMLQLHLQSQHPNLVFWKR